MSYVQLIPLFLIKDGLTETGIEPLQHFLNDQKKDRVGPFGAMFGLRCGCSWFEGRWSSSRWGCVCDTARKCKWDQLELLVTFSLCHLLLIIKTICIQKLKQRHISSWLELRDLTWNHDNGKVLFLFFWSFWVEEERSELSMLVPGLVYAFHVVSLISALFPLEIWMGQRYVQCKAVVEWECKQNSGVCQ